MNEVKALLFDVFGTVADWRSSIAREARAAGRRIGVEADGEAFADAWRALYQPSMEAVRSGERPWTLLDDLHRESLDAILADFGLEALDAAERDALNRAWHRLDAWPDVPEGLARLRRRYTVATCSNGNVVLLANMAKHLGIGWDAILGAEPTRHYKPQPRAYLGSAALLGLAPCECMMVAAHNADLVAAGALGLRTAFVARPFEHGPEPGEDLVARHDFDLVTGSFIGLAKRLGA